MSDREQKDDLEPLLRRCCDAPPPSKAFVDELDKRVRDRLKQVSGGPDAVPVRSRDTTIAIQNDASQGDDSTVTQGSTQPVVRLVPDVPTDLADGVPRGTHPIEKPPGRRHVLGRKLMRSRLIRIGAVAAAVACILVVGLWSSGPGAGVAWAEVRQLIEEVTTVTFEMATYQDGRSEGTAKVMFTEPGRMRTECPAVTTIFDWSQGKILTLATEEKVAHAATVTDLENPYQRNWLADLKAIAGSKEAEEAGRREISGRQAKGWRVRDKDGTCTVWADAKSGELLEAEFELGRNKMVMRQFVLNLRLDESLFALTPPEGYTLASQVKMAEADPSEADVVFLLRVWVSGNDGQFPDRLDSTKFYKACEKADWKGLGIDGPKKDQEARQAISRAFYLMYNWKSQWGYAGKGVKLGQAEAPVCWWKPVGAETYRIVFGDLSVRTVDKAELGRLTSPSR